MRTLLTAVLCLVSLVATGAPSLILVNGKIFDAPDAQAIAITGAQITAVGTDADIRALADASTRVIDVQGRLIVPGLNDAHVHPPSGSTAFVLGTAFDPSWNDLAAALASAADESPAELWIRGSLGPTLVNDATLTKEKLDKLAPGRKVILAGFHGHGMVLSSEAMKALGIAANATDPLGGRYERDANKQLNGRMWEYAQFAVERKLADMASDEELADAVRGLSDEALRYGITSVQVMPTTSDARFARVVAKNLVPLRIRHISFPTDASAAPFVQPRGAIKWILDGTPIESAAALRTARYANGSSGRENFTDIAPLLKVATDKQQQLLVHAVGDKTIATALEAIGARRFERPRIEHADGLQRDLFPLMKRTGAIAVLNPSHFQFRNFFPERGLYGPAQTLVKAGIPIAIGSDGPLNPYLNILMATARQDQPEESLTCEQALHAYTSGSAFAEFADKKGKIAPGMLADVAVLSQNILEVPPEALPATESVLTIVDGKVVFER
jgi:predicted amidohydrolase YtcJ